MDTQLITKPRHLALHWGIQDLGGGCCKISKQGELGGGDEQGEKEGETDSHSR